MRPRIYSSVHVQYTCKQSAKSSLQSNLANLFTRGVLSLIQLYFSPFRSGSFLPPTKKCLPSLTTFTVIRKWKGSRMTVTSSRLPYPLPLPLSLNRREIGQWIRAFCRLQCRKGRTDGRMSLRLFPSLLSTKFWWRKMSARRMMPVSLEYIQHVFTQTQTHTD